MIPTGKLQSAFHNRVWIKRLVQQEETRSSAACNADLPLDLSPSKSHSSLRSELILQIKDWLITYKSISKGVHCFSECCSPGDLFKKNKDPAGCLYCRFITQSDDREWKVIPVLLIKTSEGPKAERNKELSFDVLIGGRPTVVVKLL